MFTKVAAAIAAAVAGMGGLGVAGALPGPIQDTVADVADTVGVDLPESGEESSTTTAESDTSAETTDDEADGTTEEGDTSEETTDDSADPADESSDEPRNFGEVVHEAKVDGATGQDIAQLAHERNAARWEERHGSDDTEATEDDGETDGEDDEGAESTTDVESGDASDTSDEVEVDDEAVADASSSDSNRGKAHKQ